MENLHLFHNLKVTLHSHRLLAN